MRRPSDEPVYYKQSVITAAKDLGYPDDVIHELEKATNEHELARIMATAREQERIGEAYKRGRER